MNNAIPRPGSDPIYKRLYAFARMVEDLLRTLFTKAELDVNYRSLEKLSTEYVGDAFQRRHGDTAWRLRTRGAEDWLHMLVMLEYLCSSVFVETVFRYSSLSWRSLRSFPGSADVSGGGWKRRDARARLRSGGGG